MKQIETEKATIQDWIACASRLAKALRTTPFMECKQLNHAGGKYHTFDVPCPVCAANEAALLELERLNRLAIELPNAKVTYGRKTCDTKTTGRAQRGH